MKSSLFSKKALFSLGLALAVAVHVGAQEPPAAPVEPSPSPAADVAAQEEKAAFVRVWFMATGGSDLDVRFRGSGAEAEPLVLVGAPRDFYYGTGYRDVPAGAGTVSLVTRGSPAMVKAEAQQNFRSDRFYTVIIRSRGAAASIDVIDDTLPRMPKPKPGEPAPTPPPRRAAIYNFTPDSTIELGLPELRIAQSLSFGQKTEFSVPQPTLLNLGIRLRTPNHPIDESSVEVDLQTASSLSVLLLRDLYGRFSPRVVSNGVLD